MKCTRICDFSLTVVFLTALLCRVEGEYAFIKFQANLEGQDVCILPPQIAFTLDTGNEPFVVKLRRNDHIHSKVPTFTIRTSHSGEMEFLREEAESEKRHAAYQEPEHEVALLVTCHLHDQRGSQYEMEGTLFLKSIKYRLFPSESPLTFYQRLFHSEEEKVYHLLRAKEDAPFDAGITAANHENILANTLEEIRRPVREKREVVVAVQDINIDVLLVLEYSVVKTWSLLAGGNETVGIQNAKNYFTLLMNAVNLRYKNIEIDSYAFIIRLVGFYISQERSTSPWSEDAVSSTKDGVERTNAADVLANLKNWMVNNSERVIPHDHAMLFTSYDLLGDDSGFRFNYTTGLAYVDSMCSTDGFSVSVVEDHGGFQSVGTATHELGHSLGAVHDGVNNTCQGTDRYIMAPLSYNETEATKYNPWYFSACSIDAFVDFIKNSNKTECLTGALTPSDVADVSETPGQVYKPDEQCRHLYGNNSYLCRGTDFDVNALICRAMFCYSPDRGICLLMSAARGTTCGNKKWCMNGACVESGDAPEVSATCPHGDQPYVRVNNGSATVELTCADAIGQSPHLCNSDSWFSTCCQSCEPVCTGSSECQCGDRLSGCVQEDCKNYNQTNLDICCKTCENYEPTPDPPTSQTSMTSTVSSTTTAVTTPTSQMSTTTSSDSNPTTCTDVEQYQSRTCKSFLQYFGISSCYRDEVNVSCCKTCEENVDPTREACPWGDFFPSSCYPLIKYRGVGVCPNTDVIQTYCCGTCADLSAIILLRQNTTPASPSAATINIFAKFLLYMSIVIAVFIEIR